jgi:hypothetical protein
MINQLAQTLASAYIKGASVTPTPIELATFKGWVESAYHRLPVRVEFSPIDSPLADTIKYYRKTGRLIVSTANSEHPYISPLQNAMFRAVHDWHHLLTGADDSLIGELTTYQLARDSAPRGIHWILRSEIALQAAARIVTGEFQPQKLVYIK